MEKREARKERRKKGSFSPVLFFIYHYYYYYYYSGLTDGKVGWLVGPGGMKHCTDRDHRDGEWKQEERRRVRDELPSLIFEPMRSSHDMFKKVLVCSR